MLTTKNFFERKKTFNIFLGKLQALKYYLFLVYLGIFEIFDLFWDIFLENWNTDHFLQRCRNQIFDPFTWLWALAPREQKICCLSAFLWAPEWCIGFPLMLSLLAFEEISKRVKNDHFSSIFGLSERRRIFLLSFLIMKVTSKQNEIW